MIDKERSKKYDKKGIYEFTANDPNSNSSATLTIEGEISPKLLDQYLTWFRKKWSATGTTMADNESAELEELRTKDPNRLSQEDFEKLQTLQEKKRRIDKRQSSLQTEVPTEEPQSPPIVEKRSGQIAEEKEPLDLEGLPEEDKMLMQKNPARMNQKEFEKMRAIQEGKKPPRPKGGMFGTRRKVGVLGK